LNVDSPDERTGVLARLLVEPLQYSTELSTAMDKGEENGST